MKSIIQMWVVILAAAAVSSGCVSSSEFKKMQTAKDEEIGKLQQQNTDLVKENAALQQQNAGVLQQVDALDQQRADLLAASQQQQQQYDALVHKLSKEVKRGQLQIRQYRDMLSVELEEQIFFDSGRAELKTGGKAVMKKVAEAVKDYANKIIRVVGHTDNVPIAPALQSTFPTNWELSVARATNVVRYLQDVGIPPGRMIAAGRSEYDPVATNDTPEGRQKNRRIEILLIDRELSNEMGRQAR
jgi:chemotaxis protein MotB